MIFKRGDLVRIGETMPEGMSHFPGAGARAVVVGSYSELCGSGRTGANEGYRLHIEGVGEYAWYEEQQLTLIQRGDFPTFAKHVKRMFRT